MGPSDEAIDAQRDEFGQPSLRIVLGRPGVGGQTWFAQERRDKRNRLLRDMAKEHFPDCNPGPAAVAITNAWRRYDRVRRAIDQRRGWTDGAPGTIDFNLFQLAQLGGSTGWRRTRDILAAGIKTNAP